MYMSMSCFIYRPLKKLLKQKLTSLKMIVCVDLLYICKSFSFLYVYFYNIQSKNILEHNRVCTTSQIRALYPD